LEADEAHLALLFRLGKGFENSIGGVNYFGVVVDNLVNLPDIEMVGLEPHKRFLQHAHRDILFAAMGADAAHNNDTVSPSLESDAKPFFAETIEYSQALSKMLMPWSVALATILLIVSV
jgi:hypothetical protein